MTATPGNANSATEIVGTWQLTSWSEKDMESGEVDHPLGTEPFGFITFTDEGRVSVTCVAGGRGAPETLAHVTDSEAVSLYRSLMAYAGTYHPTGPNEVEFDIEVSWNQTWTGEKQGRHFTIDGSSLTITVGPQPGISGNEILATLTWTRCAAAAADAEVTA